MPRDLQADQATLNAVLMHAQNRDWQRAGAIAEQALTSGFEHPLLLNVLATRLEHEGKFEDALRLLERAVAIAPRDVGARNALALCLQRLERPADALYHVDELLRDHAELGYVHANKGNALIALGWLGRARASHLRALELEPGNIAAMAALASIASHRGNHDEARAWAEKVLVAVPNFPDAVISLAAAELASGATERAEMLIRQLLADSRVAPSDRARAHGLLGDVLDASGRYVEAFAAYSTCNEALRQAHRRFASGTSLLAYTHLLATAMRSTAPRNWAVRSVPEPTAADALGHVFLLGFPRSGTTFLEVVLDGHPRVVSLDEHELLTDAVRRFMSEPLNLDALARADEAELGRLRRAYWDRVRRAEIEIAGKVFVDKYPMNTLKLPLIARLFPHAKILFACRDPRDVVLACFRRRFKMNAAMYELLTLPGAAAFYDAVMDFAEQLQPIIGVNWQVVRYESVMADFAQQLRAICRFIGLEWVDGMDDFASRARTREHATPSTAQLARGLDRSSVAHWQHYSAQLQPILPTLNRWVERLGYPA
jgi:tetratricopeptide (TPR) repeat protein